MTLPHSRTLALVLLTMVQVWLPLETMVRLVVVLVFVGHSKGQVSLLEETILPLVVEVEELLLEAKVRQLRRAMCLDRLLSG